ncbi:general stress protein [Umezawaea sp. Da 62-37]|uniref:general stress protein n=1 Tax=Umezawaea sp. Da 62-37 TaxID=3075927 RepID=UPI0028F6C994|nr:general stress protein [Umezawaea sp. Da 62-37]WNV84826.1 general stress protein [Umezawaea sp. Da 62-37]
MTDIAATGHVAGSSMKTVGGQVSLGSFATYGEAQSVVEYLAGHQFEVRTTQIIGSDLRVVEQVTGRLTWPRAILAGMASGAWFGVFVGLVFSFLSTSTVLVAIGFGIGWGLLFGGVFGAAGYGLTRGRRDFTSLSATVPSRFEVLVADSHADRARTVLATANR